MLVDTKRKTFVPQALHRSEVLFCSDEGGVKCIELQSGTVATFAGVCSGQQQAAVCSVTPALLILCCGCAGYMNMRTIHTRRLQLWIRRRASALRKV